MGGAGIQGLGLSRCSTTWPSPDPCRDPLMDGYFCALAVGVSIKIRAMRLQRNIHAHAHGHTDTYVHVVLRESLSCTNDDYFLVLIECYYLHKMLH